VGVCVWVARVRACVRVFTNHALALPAHRATEKQNQQRTRAFSLFAFCTLNSSFWTWACWAWCCMLAMENSDIGLGDTPASLSPMFLCCYPQYNPTYTHHHPVRPSFHSRTMRCVAHQPKPPPPPVLSVSGKVALCIYRASW
jgi:hypothetical protein